MSWEHEEEGRDVEGEWRGLVKGEGEEHRHIQCFHHGFRELLGEGAAFHGDVEEGDLMEQPHVFTLRGVGHDVHQSSGRITSRHGAFSEKG